KQRAAGISLPPLVRHLDRRRHLLQYLARRVPFELRLRSEDQAVRPAGDQQAFEVVRQDEAPPFEESGGAAGFKEDQGAPRASSEVDLWRTAGGVGETGQIVEQLGGDMDLPR